MVLNRAGRWIPIWPVNKTTASSNAATDSVAGAEEKHLDEKGDIMNTKDYKLHLTILFLILLLVSGCQKTPEQGIVTSKNDGAFEAALESTSAPGTEPLPQESEPFEASAPIETLEQSAEVYEAQFQTTDINCSVNVEFPLASAAPVLQVRPKQIDADTARRIGEVLFEDSQIYEYSTERSKQELEELILGLRQFISDRATLVEYYNGDEETADRVTAEYEARIASYEQEYASAKEEVVPQPCAWEFHPQSYYSDLTDSMAASDISYNKTNTIKAIGTIDGLPYCYDVYVRNESDYRTNMAFFYIDDLSVPDSALYSMDEPSEEDQQRVREHSEALVEQMDLGEWVVDSCEITRRQSLDGEQRYNISVYMTPVYDGIKVTRQKQIVDFTSDDQNAANYMYESIRLNFAGDRLLEFEYQGGLEKVGIINEAVQLIGVQTVKESFETFMNTQQASQFAISYTSNNIKVVVNEVEFGFSRIRIKDNNTDFYLVPSYTFVGTVTPLDEKGNTLVVEGPFGEQIDPTERVKLVTINAVDGSIVNVKLGY